MAQGRPRRDRRLTVYLLPARIQQGWGDVSELSLAAWALHRAGFRLCRLPPVGPTRGRTDPRAVPVDPAAGGVVVFPPVERLDRPTGEGRALVLATWWGLAARTVDAEGGPLPGSWAGTVARVVEAHGGHNVLHVSLEEFASDQTSRSALDEGLRQAGWDAGRRRRALGSAEGKAQRERYRHAFELARGGEREDVLHLTASFAPDLAACREFPFLLPVGPFGPSGRSGPGARRSPTSRGRDPLGADGHRVLWYASPPSSPKFASLLKPALVQGRSRVAIDLRSPSEHERGIASALQGEVEVRELGALGPQEWRKALERADLRIVSGSQTLVEATRLLAPFLYFNGVVQGDGELPRAFRREKLLSLLRGLRRTHAPIGLVDDLNAFADGRELPRVLDRALRSPRWRSSMVRALERLPRALPPAIRSGDAFLVAVAGSLRDHPGDVPSLVRQVRASHHRWVGPSRARNG